MERNTLLAVILSTAFLILWWTFFQPSTRQNTKPTVSKEQVLSESKEPVVEETVNYPKKNTSIEKEEEVVIETAKYKAVFSSLGGSIKHWVIKESHGKQPDLVLKKDSKPLATFDDINFNHKKTKDNEVIFSAVLPQGWRIVKTYSLSDEYLHNLKIELKKTKRRPEELPFMLEWGPGLGTDMKELKENNRHTRPIGYFVNGKSKLEKFKPGEYSSGEYRWIGIDNRYFLAAIIPDPKDFSKINVTKSDKKAPPSISISKIIDKSPKVYHLRFYLGPKSHNLLKALKLNLEESIDFGVFGFLGKVALASLNGLFKITGNYGWAIMFMTVCIQILVLPLSLKSFKASAEMKHLQPEIKALQEKYKSDPKRLNVEMMNLYKTKKVNPLGGCLPMLLQLPIFWALFTTLRNAYELRGAEWIFWIKDLSAHDPYFILPILMGAGMLIQQKIVSVSADPAQARMMYMMPIIFTFMFLKFPAGLVLYWLTNSILTTSEQYFIIHKPAQNKQ